MSEEKESSVEDMVVKGVAIGVGLALGGLPGAVIAATMGCDG